MSTKEKGLVKITYNDFPFRMSVSISKEPTFMFRRRAKVGHDAESCKEMGDDFETVSWCIENIGIPMTNSKILNKIIEVVQNDTDNFNVASRSGDWTFKRRPTGNRFYFKRKRDAMAFKLVFNHLIYDELNKEDQKET